MFTDEKEPTLYVEFKSSELDVIEASLATASSSYDAVTIGVAKLRALRASIRTMRERYQI